jgi:hypothetical protein
LGERESGTPRPDQAVVAYPAALQGLKWWSVGSTIAVDTPSTGSSWRAPQSNAARVCAIVYTWQINRLPAPRITGANGAGLPNDSISTTRARASTWVNSSGCLAQLSHQTKKYDLKSKHCGPQSDLDTTRAKVVEALTEVRRAKIDGPALIFDDQLRELHSSNTDASTSASSRSMPNVLGKGSDF